MVRRATALLVSGGAGTVVAGASNGSAHAAPRPCRVYVASAPHAAWFQAGDYTEHEIAILPAKVLLSRQPG